MFNTLKTGLFLLLTALPLFGEELPTRLNVGCKAPPLKDVIWVQGQPVKDFNDGNVYVVEFWGTQCSPCLKIIPKLNEIHEKYKNKKPSVTVIGVETTNLHQVSTFLKSNSGRVNYTVASDVLEEVRSGSHTPKTKGAWAVIGIPTTFIIKNGVIQTNFLSPSVELVEAIRKAEWDACPYQPVANHLKVIDKSRVKFRPDSLMPSYGVVTDKDVLFLVVHAKDGAFWGRQSALIESKQFDQALKHLAENKQAISMDGAGLYEFHRARVISYKRDAVELLAAVEVAHNAGRGDQRIDSMIISLLNSCTWCDDKGLAMRYANGVLAKVKKGECQGYARLKLIETKYRNDAKGALGELRALGSEYPDMAIGWEVSFIEKNGRWSWARDRVTSPDASLKAQSESR